MKICGHCNKIIDGDIVEHLKEHGMFDPKHNISFTTITAIVYRGFSEKEAKGIGAELKSFMGVDSTG